MNQGPDIDGLPFGDKGGANLEKYLGTDPLKSCNKTSTSNDEASDAWHADLNDSGAVSIQDVLALKPVFNQAVPPASPRYDIVPSKTITVQDVLALKPVFNTRCGITTRIDLEPDYELTNTATLIGSPETCLEVPSGGPIEIDVTVSAVPAVSGGSGGLTGYDFTLQYDQSKIRVTAINYSMMLAANGISAFTVIDTLPDTDGQFGVAVADIGSSTPESGAGVLARITVETLANGMAPVAFLQNNVGLTGGLPGFEALHTAKSIGATLAIGTSCP
jgi:hypothetical protein